VKTNLYKVTSNHVSTEKNTI